MFYVYILTILNIFLVQIYIYLYMPVFQTTMKCQTKDVHDENILLMKALIKWNKNVTFMT